MKRHKVKDNSGKNRVFYIHASNVHGPLPSIEDAFVVEGPDSKEDFEDFRFDNWDKIIQKYIVDSNNHFEDDVLIAMNKHEAEKLYSMLGRILNK